MRRAVAVALAVLAAALVTGIGLPAASGQGAGTGSAGDVAALKGQVATLKGQVGRLQADVRALKQMVGQLSTDNAALGRRAATSEATVKDVGGVLDCLRAQRVARFGREGTPTGYVFQDAVGATRVTTGLDFAATGGTLFVYLDGTPACAKLLGAG